MIKSRIKRALSSIRLESKANMFWGGKKEYPNFGDLIGPYLYEKLTGKTPNYREPGNLALTTEYVTVRSLIHWVRMSSIIWGSGVVFENQTFTKPQKR